MIFPRHPISNNFILGQPHVFLIKPLSQSDKKSSSSRSAAVDANKNDRQHDQTGEKTTTNDSQPTVIYQDRGIQIDDTGDGYRMMVDMPGVKSSDCHVQLHEGVLRIEAERKYGDACGNATTVSKFARSFLVADDLIDETKLQAKLEDGVLTLTIPKKDEAKPIAIPVIAGYPPEEERANNKEDIDKDIRVSVDVPGVRAVDLKLEFHYNRIRLQAERKGGRFAGIIEKEMPVDTQRIDPASFKAYLMDGVLTITVARKPAVEPKKIAISSAPQTIEGKKDGAVVVETVAIETE